MRKKAVCVSLQEAGEQTDENEIKRIDMSLPAYISIDKDVLDRYGARTNWNQGGMSVRTLERLLSGVFANQKVIGVDICGECSLQEPLREFLEDSRINQTTNRNLYSFLSGRLYSSQPS